MKDFELAANREKNYRVLTSSEMKNLIGGNVKPTACFCFCWDENSKIEWDSAECDILNMVFVHPRCANEGNGLAFCQKNHWE